MNRMIATTDYVKLLFCPLKATAAAKVSFKQLSILYLINGLNKRQFSIFLKQLHLFEHLIPHATIIKQRSNKSDIKMTEIPMLDKISSDPRRFFPTYSSVIKFANSMPKYSQTFLPISKSSINSPKVTLLSSLRSILTGFENVTYQEDM